MQKYLSRSRFQPVLSNKVKCNHLYRKAADVLPAGSTPFFPGTGLAAVGAACVGADHAMALTRTATQLPRHSSTKKQRAPDHAKISASKHQKEQPAETENGQHQTMPFRCSMHSYSRSTRCLILKPLFFISILP